MSSSSDRKQLLHRVFSVFRLVLLVLTIAWLLSGYEISFGVQPSAPSAWAFPLPGVIGQRDPLVDAQPVKWDPFATGHLATACYAVTETQPDWAKLESDAPRYAWYPLSEVVMVDKQQTCEAMRDIYYETIRSGANAVTGRLAIYIREAPSIESAEVGVLQVGQTALIMGIYPEEGNGTVPWLLVEHENGTAGYVRSDLILYVRADEQCAQTYETEGDLRWIVADEGVELPAPPETLQAVAALIKRTSPYAPRINQPRMVYFTSNHSELVRIAPAMWRQVVGVYSYARWDGCHVQSRHTGVGDLMATAVVDMSHGDTLTNWQITIHELTHLYGTPHEGWLNSYDWEILIALALSDTCQDAADEYLAGLCTELSSIIN